MLCFCVILGKVIILYTDLKIEPLTPQTNIPQNTNFNHKNHRKNTTILYQITSLFIHPTPPIKTITLYVNLCNNPPNHQQIPAKHIGKSHLPPFPTPYQLQVNPIYPLLTNQKHQHFLTRSPAPGGVFNQTKPHWGVCKTKPAT